jgi:hypothetical protein
MSDFLCRNVKLSIQRMEEGAQIRLVLRNDLTLNQVEICYQVTQREDGAQRRYHLREAMVIAMRRLVGQAIESGLISDSPGVLTSLKSGTTKPPDPSITFMTDGDSL